MLPSASLCLLVSVPVLLVHANVSSPSKAAAPASPAPRPPSPRGDHSWAFGLRLYQALRSDTNAVNTLFSPLLVASSLAALSAGSEGTTATQIQKLLKPASISKTGAQVGELLSQAVKSVAEANGTSFHAQVSSGVFSKQAASVSKAFAKESQSRFRLQHQTLGKGDSKADLKQLHKWAKATVRGLEGAPLMGDGLQLDARALILTNALHFKGLWERGFSEDDGDRRAFLGKKYTKVVLMHRAGLYRHYEDIQNMVQVLEIPLWDGKASVVLLLPFHVEKLDRLEKLLTPELISEWLEKAAIGSVAVSLPKANISCSLSLQKQLSALGLSEAWDPKTADFPGVSDKGKGGVHLGAVFHWASVELAAEAGRGEAELAEENIEKPKLFYADHPFLMLVRENASGALLLMGALDHAEGEALHDEL